MAEPLPAEHAGRELAEHGRTDGTSQHDARSRDRALTIAEGALLAIVTLLAAWSGYAAAQWSTEASVELASASRDRTNASRLNLEAMEVRNLDSSAFGAWFTAYVAGDTEAMAVAERRFRPEFAVAFDAWRATNPDTNPDAPRGPTYMPQYRQPALEEATALDDQAEEEFAGGTDAGQTSDSYVRVTVFLASVLFLVGISTHFALRSVRFALVALAAVVLVASLVQIAQLPRPP